MRLLRRNGTRDRVSNLIRHGVGVHEASWPPPLSTDASAVGTLVEEILTWMRETMALMRRPYGIDFVAVAFACRDAGGLVVCSNSLGVLRPADFYGEEGSARVRAFLGEVESVPREQRAEIVGAVLSLGDLAYAMEPPAAA